MAKLQRTSQSLKSQDWKKIENLAEEIKNSSPRLGNIGDNTLQAIAYVLLKEGNNSPTQLEINDAVNLVIDAQQQVTTVATSLLDILGKIDEILRPKGEKEFKPSPLRDYLPEQTPTFTARTIANLDRESAKIPLKRIKTPGGMICKTTDTGPRENSRAYAKLLLYMRFGSKYAQVRQKLLESDVAEIFHARSTTDSTAKEVWKQDIIKHFVDDTQIKGDQGDYTQKIDLLFTGLDQLVSNLVLS